jgi:Domain of unknown function (DUF4351)
VTAETLLFRLMGKGRVQQTAMVEVAALPVEYPYRKSLLNLQDLVLQLLARRVGKTSAEVERRVRSLSTEQLGFLGEALLDFKSMGDLTTWFQNYLLLNHLS